MTANQLVQSLAASADFPKPPITRGHRLAALLVACTMSVLPVLYLLFVAGIAWMTWWHATHDYVWMTNPEFRERLVGALVYVGLVAVGAMWILSLIRPLFAKLGAAEMGTAIPRDAEPELFAFADVLATKVGAPRPEVICLSLDVNASASFETTLFGLKRRSLTLTLGVPLVAGLTVSQLAGVMAHEFGHFSQGGSSLLDRLIRRVNLWFALAAHPRSSIDELIASLSRTSDKFNRLLAFALRFLVGGGRVVLRLLGTIGLFAGASLMRRMELDADRYEIGLVGSSEFAETGRRILALQYAQAEAFENVLGSIHRCHLPTDLGTMIAELADRSPRVKAQAEAALKQQQQRWLSSHPSADARLSAARNLDLPGTFHSPVPSTALFREFQKSSESLTALFYQARYGRLFSAADVRPTQEVVDRYLELAGSRQNAP